jgi:2-amino-4-hydroxy-6-hydroxymethyldihydropteridine diphosphokinase
MNDIPLTSVVAYIGLGSNLNDPIHQIRRARLACAKVSGVRELAFSSLYRSQPMGPQDQPDYINAVMSVETVLSAAALLHELQAIENQQGRVRTSQRWTARTLDLDLLVYGESLINETDLVVPHPGISERAFVLFPLYEIAPDLIVPGKGPISGLIADCPPAGLKRIT